MKRKGREVNKNRLGLILPTEPELRCCRDLAVGPRFASQQVQTRHTTFWTAGRNYPTAQNHFQPCCHRRTIRMWLASRNEQKAIATPPPNTTTRKRRRKKKKKKTANKNNNQPTKPDKKSRMHAPPPPHTHTHTTTTTTNHHNNNNKQKTETKDLMNQWQIKLAPL